ncbi:MAG: sulfite exporter TauE/SafE family protein [Balneolaceae bacterium]
MLLAWTGALLVGLSLGLLGSGGSILTVPILIYLVGESEKEAIAESLGIVGAISLAGLVPYALKKQIHWQSAIVFGLPGMGGTYLGAIIAAYVSGTFQLILFAIVMVTAAVLMLIEKKPDTLAPPKPNIQPWWLLASEGLAVGVLTGLVGVGGGFLIVPALVLLAGLPIHVAIGTSLTIIAMKSLTGFIKYIDVLDTLELSVNWNLVLIFSLIGAAGSFLGKAMGSKISGIKLKKVFAVFLLLMGGFILFMNF